VTAPSGAPDAGVLALASVSRRLGVNSSSRTEWATLRSSTSKLLAEPRTTPVLLVIDEPSSWTAAGGVFARRAEEAIETLFGPSITWPAVVCDQSAAPGALILPNAVRDDLLGPEWDLLAGAASQLSSLPIASEFRTPLQQRLAAALIAWESEPDHADSHRLGVQLAETLVQRRHGGPLWGLWQRLALARVTLDAATLDALGAGRLSRLAAATLRVALLDGADRLHDVLRTIPEDRPPDPELVAEQRREAHEMLFEHHYSKFTDLASANQPQAADHAAEALFHAGELDDETRLTLVNVDLAEQLNALGHRLGSIRGDHAGAVTAYRRALLADPEDAYAIHHLAFHLDAQGLEAAEVEAGYSRSIKVEPAHGEWHARRVAFLADTGRPAAARLAWAHAESALADDRGDVSLYTSLHLKVAASLLAIGELSFCAYVLDGVPEYARDAQHRSLSTLLAGRLAGQDNGAFVPAPRSGLAWWELGPERLPARDTDGRSLHAWLAGRVEDVDDSEVHLHVARVDPATGPNDTGLLRMTFEDLADRSLDAIDPRLLTRGKFVEIGRYRDDKLGDRTGIVVLSPPAVSLPLDILPASRWQTDAIT
jgi:tetratricopeptide (TPR) repeat protein